MTSYTVTAGTSPVQDIQFRTPQSALDVNLLRHAQQIYGRFVPHCEPFGRLDLLHVYMTDLVPGAALSLAQRPLYSIESYPFLVRTVEDFATFFTSAWHQGVASDTRMMQVDYSDHLNQLVKALPACFRPKLEEVLERLLLLFTPDYPQVINHGDMLEPNIHMDPQPAALPALSTGRTPRSAHLARRSGVSKQSLAS
ncbi:hypothetical protein M422DRAFT_253690 [Sphaerobolus stellatus SS14]|uniref:Protein-ribulosamine 3-kinase n=1 Tax=Sphaerobolus stellatus (strain SS14) TaxID=990650 RepID=A0A0C9VWJ0_SPHS4|nr:hypothetical protein M422DRAFT_253690 [Sphaerobolus stellatus SS14]